MTRDIDTEMEFFADQIAELEDLLWRSKDLLLVYNGMADPRADQVAEDIHDIEFRIENMQQHLEKLGEQDV